MEPNPTSQVHAGRYELAIDAGDPSSLRELLEWYRLELSAADPIELVLHVREPATARALAGELQRLKFGLRSAPKVRTIGASDEVAVQFSCEDEPFDRSRLLGEAHATATLLGPADCELLGRLGGVPTLLIGADHGSVRALRAAAAAAGMPLVARHLPRRLAEEPREAERPSFDCAELGIQPRLAYLDPDTDESAGYLYQLANELPEGGLVAVPQTVRGSALTRDALASGLYAFHERGDALVVLRRVAGAQPRPILPPAEQAAADEGAMLGLLRALVGRDWDCVDVGAAWGGVLRVLTEIAPAGRHHGFEPLPHQAAALREAFPSVVIHELALAAESGRSAFVHVQDAAGFSGLLRRPGTPDGEVALIEVETARLDDVLPPGYSPGLVKIDTEGGEGEVVAGGIETLTRSRPVILFEHGLPAALSYGTASCDIWDSLCERCGLEIYTLEGHGPYTRSEFSGPKLHWNFVAVRPELGKQVARAPWFA